MTISEAQSDEESDCHRRYSYNSEQGGSAWALNDTETILVSVFTYIDNWCGRRNPSPARSLHHHKAPQCQGYIWEWWLITAARGWAVHPLVLCRPVANECHRPHALILDRRPLPYLKRNCETELISGQNISLISLFQNSLFFSSLSTYWIGCNFLETQHKIFSIIWLWVVEHQKWKKKYWQCNKHTVVICFKKIPFIVVQRICSYFYIHIACV